MPRLAFTSNLRQLLPCPEGPWPGQTVREVLDNALSRHEPVRAYVLDDQGALRKHVLIFVNGQQITDRRGLADPVGADDEVFVMQALSGG